jgi:hypothetical protein
MDNELNWFFGDHESALLYRNVKDMCERLMKEAMQRVYSAPHRLQGEGKRRDEKKMREQRTGYRTTLVLEMFQKGIISSGGSSLAFRINLKQEEYFYILYLRMLLVCIFFSILFLSFLFLLLKK